MKGKSKGSRSFLKKRTKKLLFAGIAAMPVLVSAAHPAPLPDEPKSLGFAHFYKCPSDADVAFLGDTVTAKACLAACQARGKAAGCWWLDGTGGFPRECRVCRTLQPARMRWPNDWAMPLSPFTS